MKTIETFKNEQGFECITYEDALEVIEEGEMIHTFKFGTGIALGCDWQRKHILEELGKHSIQVAGPNAMGMGHGIYCNGLYIQTRDWVKDETFI